MGIEVAKQWLEEAAKTANAKDYNAHMDLISKHVQVYGQPGFDVIDYNDWAKQRQHEFEQGLLKQVSYSGFRVVTVTPRRIKFRTIKTVEGTDGAVNKQGIEVLLELEDDEKWRVVQERVLSAKELDFDRQRFGL
jgi:hypothetical protein